MWNELIIILVIIISHMPIKYFSTKNNTLHEYNLNAKYRSLADCTTIDARKQFRSKRPQGHSSKNLGRTAADLA